MADNSEIEYLTNLARLLCAEIYFLAGLTAAREMYGKSYFSLGGGEKATVDQVVSAQIGGNLQWLTPAIFAAPTPGQKAGFQVPDEQAKT